MKILTNVVLATVLLSMMTMSSLRSFYEIIKYDNLPFTDYDLFLASLISDDFDLEEDWADIPWDVWQEPDSIPNLPIEWVYNREDFAAFDKVTYGIRNSGSMKMYYMSWGEPNSRVRRHYFVHRDGETESYPFGGFGCGTGIYLHPLPKGDSAISEEMNPFYYFLFHWGDIDLSDKVVQDFVEHEIGDSISIQFSLATYSLPYSSYEPQEIRSPMITVSSAEVMENLRSGKHWSLSKDHYTPSGDTIYNSFTTLHRSKQSAIPITLANDPPS